MAAPENHTIRIGANELVVRQGSSAVSALGIRAKSVEGLAEALKTASGLMRPSVDSKPVDRSKTFAEALREIDGVEVPGTDVDLIRALMQMRIGNNDPISGIGVAFETNAASVGSMEIKDERTFDHVMDVLGYMFFEAEREAQSREGKEGSTAKAELLFKTIVKVMLQIHKTRGNTPKGYLELVRLEHKVTDIITLERATVLNQEVRAELAKSEADARGASYLRAGGSH